MQIKRYNLEKLTPRTCELHNAIEGVACNKTMFLLQEKMQIKEESVETWTIKNYEKDRFGLINGVIYLIRTRKAQSLEMFFPESPEGWFLKFDGNMKFKDISEEIDVLYN